VGDVAPDNVEEAIGVALAVEVAGLLRPCPPAGLVPPVRPLVDARHEPSRTLDSVLKKSSGSEDYNGAIRALTVTIGEDKTAGQGPF
jgi:hypothetical protein